MTASTLKKKIYEYIDSTDEKILQVVYTILEEHIKSKKEEEHQLTQKDIAELDRRWEKYKKGETKLFSLNEAKKEIRQKLKTVKH